MKPVTSAVALVVLTLGVGSAAARNGGLATWTCIDRPGVGALASNGAACPRQGNPYESAASATERIHAAWLKRYPDEASLEATRQQTLERMRAKVPADEQEAAAARVNRVFDAQLKRMRPLWQQP